MAIRFPTMNVASSVVNRILNSADELGIWNDIHKASQPQPAAVPSVPDPSMEGAQLDQALAQPVAEMPPLDDNPMSETAGAIEPILQGGDSLDGILDTISGM